MSKNIFYDFQVINFMLKMMFVIVNVHILCCENKSRPKSELFDAFRRFVSFGPTLFGQKFTEQDEELYAAGTKLEDVHLEIEEMTSKHGYPLEQYELITEDGYILRVFRIRGAGQAVFLMHGLLLSADDFLSPGLESGLAYLFAEEGFDVWLGNARGAKYSRAHTSLSPHSAAFWDFSWDEIGRYDLPVMIDFVLTSTNLSQILYVGHSQGTTAFFVMASERPEYNDKISLMVALAPAGAIPNLKSPLLQFINYGTLLHPDILFAELREHGLNELTQTNEITEAFSYAACGKSLISIDICNNLGFVMSGFNKPQLNYTSLATVLSHLSSVSVALKQIEHYAQTVTFQRFARFDYGAEKNEVLYGNKIPPEYNLSAITIPLALFYGADDWLATEIDTFALTKKLNNVVGLYKVPDPEFKHLDFLFAKDLRELVFIPMLNQIKKSLTLY